VSRTASLDLAPGVIVLGRRISSGTALPPGLSLQVSLNPSRYLSLTTEVFTVRRRDYRYLGLRAISSEEYSDTGIMTGVRVGQWPGAVAGVLPLIASLFTATVVSTP
jgi:hypothetical protein